MQNKIEKKLAEIRALREQVLAQLHALAGAEQMLNALLADFEEEKHANDHQN